MAALQVEGVEGEEHTCRESRGPCWGGQESRGPCWGGPVARHKRLILAVSTCKGQLQSLYRG